MTLGCGSGGKNITTDNVTASHLLNIQRVARRRINNKFMQVDVTKYLDESLDSTDLEKEYHKNS
jgi:acetaldehyde dehydrogenase/alcohol dehydrogenase